MVAELRIPPTLPCVGESSWKGTQILGQEGAESRDLPPKTVISSKQRHDHFYFE